MRNIDLFRTLFSMRGLLGTGLF